MHKIRSIKIKKFQYEFDVDIYLDELNLYSIYLYVKSNVDQNDLRCLYQKVAMVELISDSKLEMILSKIDQTLDQYLKDKEKLHEISETQVIYNGLNAKPKCTCCEQNIEFYSSK